MIVGLVVGGVLVRRRRASHRLSPPNPRKVKAVQEGVYLRVVHAATERFVLVDPVNALVLILGDLIHRRRDANPPDPSRRTDEPGREPISARALRRLEPMSGSPCAGSPRSTPLPHSLDVVVELEKGVT